MKKTKDISEEDSALFREAVGSITPIKQENILHRKPKEKVKRQKTEIEKPSSQSLYDSEFEQNLLERGDELFFCPPWSAKTNHKKITSWSNKSR